MLMMFFLTANDTDLLVETKQILSSHFDMKDLREASYVLGIQILRDRPSGILKRLKMQLYSSSKAPIVKGDKFSKGPCPYNDIERD